MVVRSEEAKYITQEILKEIRPCEEKPAVVWKSVADATSKLREWILDTKNKDIKIDLYTYSGETFIQHLIDIFKEMCSKDSPPVISSIFLRILTRDCQKKLVIPCEKYGKGSKVWKSNMRYRDRNIRSTFISDIENTLKKALPQTTVKLHIKVCPFEPLFKGIMVNEKNGLFGFYPIEKITKPLQHKRITRIMTIWDYIGYKTKMIEISEEPTNQVTREIFEYFNQWFNLVWNNFSDLVYPPVKPPPPLLSNPK